MTDEQIIREALQSCSDSRDYYERQDFKTDALDRLTARCIPELPDGWMLRELRQYHSAGSIAVGVFSAAICLPQFSPQKDFERWICGEGPTPRAACEAAIAQIGKQP